MAEGELTREMGERIRAWLDGPAGSDRLIEWLQGHGLPPVGYADEPYLWLLRGIDAIGPEASRKQPKRTYDDLFCEQVANLLKARPDRERPGERPEQVLYNLFLLCAGLRCPNCLAAPLQAILEAEVLQGSWLGIDLRTTLRSAAVENQVHEKLREVWLAMIRGESAFLPGDEFTGFTGLLKMPESEQSRGNPATYAIAQGLTAFIRRLEADKDEDSRARLVEILDTVRAGYPKYKRWDQDLVEVADRDDWPTWAVSTLPAMSPVLHRTSEYHVWKVVADCVRDFPGICTAAAALCGGYIIRLHVSDPSALDILKGITGRIDAILDAKKDLGYRSVLCYINQIMMDFEDAADDPRETVETARRGLLERSQVLTTVAP